METNIPKIKPEWLEGINMTSEQKSKWLAALRSGKYQQGTGKLFYEGKYCCLGVKCAALDGNQRPSGFYLMDGFLPIVRAPSSLQDTLAEMNDNGVSFKEIADFIEANIPACDEARS